MNTAEYLIKKLEEIGINDFFGLPGDYNFDILYAIENNPNTKWIGCTNELNAGYAADGYARQKGFGAIVTTYGVGELSAINAIAGSYAENVPVINIVGVPTTKNIADKTPIHHNFSEPRPSAYIEAYRQFTETTAFLNRDNAKMEIDRVLKVFIKERKPVYIAIPIDIAKMEISEKNVDYSWNSDEKVLSQVVNIITDKINKSKKPVILGDILVKRFDSNIEYKEFVEKTGIPTTNFLMGATLINSELKNYIGTYFSNLANPIAKEYLEETDCLIAVGTIYSDLNSFGLNLPYKINSHIAIYGTYTYVDGIKYENIRMSDILEKLTDTIEHKDFIIEKPSIGYKKTNVPNGNLKSDYIYPRLQEFIKENDIIIAETGTIPQGLSQVKFPQNVELHTQILWGSIGWATPATLGVSIAKPNSRVLLITGEGSHQLTALELGNMFRLGIKPVIIVINNYGYTIERLLSNNPDDKFNDVIKMNYSKFARSFEGDVWAIKVETEDDFDKALKVTQIMNKLCYIEACTEKLDTPNLTKDMINKFKSKSKTESVNLPEIYSKVQKEELKINKINFGTKVHESLKD